MTTDPPPAPHPPPRRRWRRHGAAALAGLPLFLWGGLPLAQRGPEPTVRPWEGPVPAAAHPGRAPRAGEDLDRDGLDDALEAAVARRHAPRYRFTAHDPHGPPSRQNRDEEYFPLSVARFLAELEAGVYRTRGGVVRAGAPGRFEDDRVAGFPSRLAGDPPGAAPLYVHVYPGAAAGEAFCEYWVFYGHDRADARLLGVPTPLGDHRGDWEHTAYRVALDPPRVLEGYYYGHGQALLVRADELELVDGAHPVVYVSQGKHASYPAACQLASTGIPEWLVEHHDVANGRGPTWDAWHGELVDLGERERPSPAAAAWLGFRGRWGPDGLFGRIGASPTGPAAKASWGRNGPGVPWREALERRGGRLLGP